MEPQVGRVLMAVGAVAFLVGLLLASGVRIPFGRLPGDIVIERGHGVIYIPIVSCLVLSIVLSLVSWLLRR